MAIFKGMIFLYISGTLKNKTIDFYREKIVAFDTNSFNTSLCYLSYTGELKYPPWAQAKETKLIKRQNLYIQQLEQKVLELFKQNRKCGTDYYFYTTEVRSTINMILNTPRNITFAFLETLYVTLKNSKDIILSLRDFRNMLSYVLEHIDLYTATDIDYNLKLFLNGEDYSLNNLKQYKLNTLHINVDDISDDYIYQIYNFGEFVAPKRLAKISNSLQNEELSRYIAPIYLAIKNDLQAQQFLNYCKVANLDSDIIIKNAIRCRVPDNLINMVRR